MGELGARLRDERERRGIGIDQIEAETRIRAKFLLAIEEERFDALPGPAYVRAFVRDYAEQLGIDPQALLAELNARPDLNPDIVVVPPRRVDTVPMLDPRVRIAAWIVAAVIAAAVVAIAAVYLHSRGGSPAGAGRIGRTQPLQTTPPTGTGTGTGTGTTTPVVPPRPAAFDLFAKGGSVWLQVRQGSATGRLLYQNTLAHGRHLRFAHPRLWVRVGAPWNLAIERMGRPLAVPLQSLGDILITPAGARITA